MAVESVTNYKDVLIVLGAAGIAVPLLRRVGINTILGFLIVGVVLSPGILDRLAKSFPVLENLKLAHPDSLAAFAEFGVVFLMFLIGLELSLQRLQTMKRLVFGLGALQVLLSAIFLTALMHMLGFVDREALILGFALSLSSTAVVIQIFADDKRLGSQAGRTSFAVLLMQDLAVIPILLLVKISGGGSTNFILKDVLIAVAQAGVASIIIIFIARYALRPFMRLVAGTQSADLFMAAVLLIAVGCGALATWAGLSMSLGAFIGGLMLAETEYRRAIEATIEPFKGLLLGSFFLLVGLGMQTDGILQFPFYIFGLATLLIATKATIIFCLGKLFRLSNRVAFESALLLGPCGEFAFVVIAAAKTLGLFALPETANILLIVTLTMMAIPALAKFAQRTLQKTARAEMAQQELPPELIAHVIIAGYGRVGTLIGAMLDEHKIPFIAVDGNVAVINTARKTENRTYFGDASNPEFLRKCGLASARALAVTMDNPIRAEEIVQLARAERADLKIIARARDEQHAARLYEAGATEAVPETIEASLQLGEALLVETGVPMGLAIASVHERRDGFRKLLGRPNRKEILARSKKSFRDRLK
jgi:Kef-type K+ transport system membrane component KefB/voltage-gated potassium channel Kch